MDDGCYAGVEKVGGHGLRMDMREGVHFGVGVGFGSIEGDERDVGGGARECLSE